FAALAHVVSDEGRHVHTHESDQGAEVQHLCTQAIAEQADAYQQRPSQGNRAHEEDIISWHMSLGIHNAEERLGQSLAPSHAVKQAGGANLCAHPGTEIRNQQGETYDRKKWLPGAPPDEGERGIHIPKWLRGGP